VNGVDRNVGSLNISIKWGNKLKLKELIEVVRKKVDNL